LAATGIWCAKDQKQEASNDYSSSGTCLDVACISSGGAYVNNQQAEEFDKLARAMMQWLAINQHPHTHVVITANTAELSEGVRAFQTDEYLVD
jgi:hypothetical protein